jgi:hypothetical protein
MEPHSVVHFPVTYTPKLMDRSAARLVLARADGLKWEFPVLGTPEIIASTPCWKPRCSAREHIQESLTLTLEHYTASHQEMTEE